MLKSAKIGFIVILVCVLAVAYFRNTICRFLLSQAAVKSANLKLSIKDLDLDILHNSLYMHGVTLFNPLGFKNKILVQAEEISIKYNLPQVLKGRVYLKQVKADISEINIIRNKQESFNMPVLKKEVFSVQPPSQGPPNLIIEQRIKQKGKSRRFFIEKLELSIRKLSFENYQAKIGQTAAVVYESKGPFYFNNVTDLENLIGAVIEKAGLKNLLSNP